MNSDITADLVEEHRLIIRMLALLEIRALLAGRGEYRNWQFFLDVVDFIRNYADRFHHAKEENVLFEALVENGMPRQNSPVAAMLLEHDYGRGLIRGLEKGVILAQQGEPDAKREVAANAAAFVELLREHIEKEDTVLYPLAERLIPRESRDALLARYREAEQKSDVGSAERFRGMVAGYEAERLPSSAGEAGGA